MAPSALALGSLLEGEFALEEKLGAKVYRARRTHDGRELAVRIVQPANPEQTNDFLALAEAASRVRHPTLASVEAYGRLEGHGCYIATEYIAGKRLDVWADHIGIPPLSQVVELVRRLCIGLQAAARAGVVHDALNPRNVRVVSVAKTTGTRTPMKLLDLGVPAFAYDHAADPLALRFMAPEQLALFSRPELPKAFRCNETMNVHSCGSLLYYLTTGGPPFAGATASELLSSQRAARLVPPARINPQISGGLDEVIVRALALDPSERFASVAELGEALGLVSSSNIPSSRSGSHVFTLSTVPPAPPDPFFD
ncbi:MAG: serine/threonine-protein kinase, partial [Polyangiales bacterium]